MLRSCRVLSPDPLPKSPRPPSLVVVSPFTAGKGRTTQVWRQQCATGVTSGHSMSGHLVRLSGACGQPQRAAEFKPQQTSCDGAGAP